MAASAALGSQRDLAAPAPPPTSAAEAILDCLSRACRPSLCGPAGRGFAVSVLDDVQRLLQCGRPAVVCALTDLQQMFVAALAEASAARAAERQAAVQPWGSREASMSLRAPIGALSGSSETAARDGAGASSSGAQFPGAEAVSQGPVRSSKGGSAVRKQLQAAERKLSYFQSWANEQRAHGLQVILDAVASEASAHRLADWLLELSLCCWGIVH